MADRKIPVVELGKDKRQIELDAGELARGIAADARKFLNVYIAAYVKPFRDKFKDTFEITIGGIGSFLSADDALLRYLLEELAYYDLFVRFSGDDEATCSLHVSHYNKSDGTSGEFDFQIVNLLSLIELSCKTDIPCADILVMKAVSKLICKYGILYKAFVFDLDETLWPGILAEEGVEKMNEDMHSEQGKPFVSFMKYVRIVAEELGIFVAICSRNDAAQVERALKSLDEEAFPLKGQIDCVVANDNDKSENIRSIASQLSILPSAIVFIDDNKIVRDEVRQKLPEVFVPEWDSHEELITKLNASCVFERFELSKNSQQRRKQLRIIQTERAKSSKPLLLVRPTADVKHMQAAKLYAKSNQFKLMQKSEYGEDAKSFFFEIFRENGEPLGICSALTFTETQTALRINNWAISCRYFGIGLEEFILLYIASMAAGRKVYFSYQQTENNRKVQDMMRTYSEHFSETSSADLLELVCSDDMMNELKANTNLRTIQNG